jgi:hypothetical protein
MDGQCHSGDHGWVSAAVEPAAAVLDPQQHAEQLPHLTQACSSIWRSKGADIQRPGCGCFTWLLNFYMAGGLQGSLAATAALQDSLSHAAWEQAWQVTARQEVTAFQHSVFAAVRHLPYLAAAATHGAAEWLEWCDPC